MRSYDVRSETDKAEFSESKRNVWRSDWTVKIGLGLAYKFWTFYKNKKKQYSYVLIIVYSYSRRALNEKIAHGINVIMR